MTAAGLQKLSLVDYPGLKAATVFLPGCNLRCPFCHNAGLVLGGEEDSLTQMETVFSFLEKRRGLLDAVCVTGGEPLRNDPREVIHILRRAKDMGYKVKLDTNGCFPDRLSEVIDSGTVDYIAMDIKNQPLKYPMTVGISDFDIAPVMRSVQILVRSGVEHEFRTTLAHPFHELSDFEPIGRLIGGASAYYLQKFIDSGNLIKGAGVRGFSDEEMNEALATARVYVPSVKLRGL
ncbi:MAG: anaerobic ribonucleoside-triphosphate reductase activating protein [Lachnospiraceae bacterium]|nr:anaerobic ribonucleoside-triphosphate reductase activating protein [Lachnospiraceae bacterium]